MDYANTNNVEFIVDPMVLFHAWLIYYYLQIFNLIKCYKWLPGECTDWFFDNIMTRSYCVHRRYSMSQQQKIITEHALNREHVPLTWNGCLVWSSLSGVQNYMQGAPRCQTLPKDFGIMQMYRVAKHLYDPYFPSYSYGNYWPVKIRHYCNGSLNGFICTKTILAS